LVLEEVLTEVFMDINLCLHHKAPLSSFSTFLDFISLALPW
jgi:hypothetical protein